MVVIHAIILIVDYEFIHLRNNFELILELTCPTANDATHAAILDIIPGHFFPKLNTCSSILSQKN